MTRSDWESLVETWASRPVDGEVAGLLRTLVGEQTSSTSRAAEVTRIVVQPGVESLASFAQPSAIPAVTQPQTDSKQESSVASTVMKTIGMVTGVGPVVTGLLKLFGGGGNESQEAAFSPLPFSLPQQVSVEAGLAADRSFVGVGYSAQGAPRPVPATPASQSVPSIQINVQAMDSRSFADHSDDIARAVREAMLRSHSLNDVIAEL